MFDVGTQILAALQVCKSPLSFQNRISSIRQHDKDVAKYLTWSRPLTQTFSALTAMSDDKVTWFKYYTAIDNDLAVAGWFAARDNSRLARVKWDRDCYLQSDK